MAPEPHAHPADDPVNTDVRPSEARVAHEASDASFRGVVLFGVAMIVIAVLLNFGLIWVYRVWTRWDLVDKRQEYGRPPSFSQQPASEARVGHDGSLPRLPAEPTLEGLQNRGQLAGWRNPFNARAESYGWVDEKAGIAHIPVDRAAAIVARTAPSRKAPSTGSDARVAQTAAAGGESGGPGASSSGRTLQEERQ